MPLWRKRLRRHVPILKWLPNYRKGDLVADLVAGLTLGLTMIPQSIAYAALAGLTAQYGLYSTFMGSFLYVIFGTIKEVSIGPTSLMALLTFEFTKDHPFEFIVLLTFMAGCVELLMGLLSFGFLVDFISSPVTSGFQSATSIIIIASQLKGLFGLRKIKTGRFVENVILLGQKIHETRFGDLLLGLSCCVILLSLRKLKDIQIGRSGDLSPRQKMLKKALWFISISRNAIVVLVSCLIAFLFEYNGYSPFILSGNIPSGFPPFRFPAFSAEVNNATYAFTDMCNEIGSGIFILPLVAVLANVTIAKAFSSGEPVDATQEMLTLGICNITGSFVSSLPTCGAFTRSAVSNSSGVRTPMAGLFSGSLILLVLMFLTPYFYYIPRATLAAVLICAVIFMIDYKTCFILWRGNKRDFCCSVVTFSSCLALGVEVGLLVGVAVNVGQLLYLWARPSISIQIKNTAGGDYYLVTPDIGLFFPAVDFLRSELNKNCQRNLPVVIDCLHFKGVDYTTAQGISDISRDYNRRGQRLLFINMIPRIFEQLKDVKVDLDVRQCTSCDEEINDILFYSGIPESPSAIVLDEIVPDGKLDLPPEQKPLI